MSFELIQLDKVKEPRVAAGVRERPHRGPVPAFGWVTRELIHLGAEGFELQAQLGILTGF